MTRPLLAVALSLGIAASAAGAQAALAAVAPQVACASLRAFVPSLAEAPTQVTDAREAQVDGRAMCVVKG